MWIIYQADNGHEMPSLIFSEKILICYNFAEQTIHMKCKILFSLKNNKQEAHGQCLAHLSEIATADMQILCNIFSILSLQLIKGSSFEQFLVLKKNVFVFLLSLFCHIWAWQSMERDHLNKLLMSFQQEDQPKSPNGLQGEVKDWFSR